MHCLGEGYWGQAKTMSEKMWITMRQCLSPVLFIDIGGAIEPRDTCLRNSCPLSGTEKRRELVFVLSTSLFVHTCLQDAYGLLGCLSEGDKITDNHLFPLCAHLL